MAFLKGFGIHLVVLTVLLKEGSPIRCFTCTGPFDIGCDDPFDGQRVPSVDCAFRANFFAPNRDPRDPTAFPVMCKKRVETVAGQRRVTRDCASQGEIGFQGTTCQTHADGSEMCYCNYDNCNGALSLRGSTFTSLLLSVLVVFSVTRLIRG